jgi:integrase/recombinase XerD
MKTVPIVHLAVTTDADWSPARRCRPGAGVITVREAKFDPSLLVPLHPTATEALGRYAAERDRLRPRPRSGAFLLCGVGTTLTRNGVEKTVRESTIGIGVRTATVRRRVHDLRRSFHDLRQSFAVDTLIRWPRSGVNLDEHIGALSTYLGHVSPADTTGICPPLRS